MSLFAPKSCNDSVFQYCNYGFDKNTYSSTEDCLKKKMKECADGQSKKEEKQKSVPTNETENYQTEKSLLRAGIIVGVGSLVGFGIAKVFKIKPVVPIAMSCVALFSVHLLFKPHSLLKK